MEREFSPEKYVTYEELPEEQKQNFEVVDDGFIRVTFEKNPEVTQRLAELDIQAAAILEQEILEQSLSFDELFTEYQRAAEKYDYKARKKAAEPLRLLADLSYLRGGKSRTEMQGAFKQNYEFDCYSERLQQLYMENIRPDEHEVIAHFLRDEKFINKKALVTSIGNVDDLAEVYELVRGDLGAVAQIVEYTDNKVAKIEILKDSVEGINKIEDEGVRKKKQEDYNLARIQRNVAETLANDNDFDEILKLVDQGYIDIANLRFLTHRISSDRFLIELALRMEDSYDAAKVLKFVADPKVLSRVADSEAVIFEKQDESGKKEIAQITKLLAKSLQNPVNIHEAGHLAEENKFVVGVSEGDGELHIAWSNTGSHGYHRDIFETITRRTGKRFPDILRSGGYIHIEKGQSNVIMIFDGRSGDFGNFSRRILERFQDNILKFLQDKPGYQNIEVRINDSD